MPTSARAIARRHIDAQRTPEDWRDRMERARMKRRRLMAKRLTRKLQREGRA